MKPVRFFTYLIITINLLLSVALPAQVSNQEITAGSYIINMGIVPQTRNNSLRPYGFIYELIKNRIIPVKWVINPSKSKDGNDFHHNGIFYKGSAFIIPKEFITPTIQTLITTWNGLGVTGAYSAYDTILPVYATLSSWPRSVLDLDKGSIVEGYFDDALIPAAAYSFGLPSSLNICNDFFALPHADPTWATHSNFYDFVTTNKGYIWGACHAVSMLEAITNPGNTIQLNFLSSSGLQCYSSGKCNTITQVHAGSASSPINFNSSFATDPVSQYIGDLVPATNNGSEEWFIPLTSGSGWHSGVKRVITTNNGTPGNEGIKLAYGHAYNNSTYGKVMYMGGHDHGGTGANEVAAQRAFFNFVLLTGEEKKPIVGFAGLNDTLVSGNTMSFSANVSNGTGPYTYSWSSSAGGIFSNPTSATTNFTVPMVIDSANFVVRCHVTDACTRWVFQYQTGKIYTAFVLNNGLEKFYAKKVNETVVLNWKLSDNYSIEKIEIERSLNGKDFEIIAQQTPTSIYGEYTDVHLPVSKSMYYRLKITGKGKSTYSQINKIYTDNINAIAMYPNPAKSFVRLTGLSTTGKTDIRIIDLSGINLIQQTIQTSTGTYQLNELDQLKPGIYTVEFSMNGMKKREKLVVVY